MGCTIPNTLDDESHLKPNYHLNVQRFYTIEHLDTEVESTKRLSNASQIEGLKIKPSKLINSEKQYKDVKKNYKLLEKLGEGKFGKVYKVYHYPSGQTRAMKIVQKSATNSQDDERKFLKEIEVLTLLDHPNIVKIFEYFYDDNNYFVITEIVNGCELFEYFSTEQSFNEAEACSIMIQLFSAVSYLHKKGIVHRDLKLENIMLEKYNGQNVIRLIDFGASAFFKRDASFSMKIGTAYYIAPEVLENNYSYKCDSWSCGVIMYILLSGYPPFDGTSDQEIMQKVKSGKFSFDKKVWASTSQEAKNLIAKLLNINPKQRITPEAVIKEDPWLVNFNKGNLNKKDVLTTKLTRINKFRPKHKLQQACIAFLIRQNSSNKMTNELRHIFNEMDITKNGKLSFTELKSGIKKYSDFEFTESELEKLLYNLDNDGDNQIVYEEFLQGTIDMELLLTENNLKMAFNFFDETGDGYLNKEDIKSLFGVMNENPEMENELINNIIGDLKQTNKGKISFEEFKELMQHALTKEV